MLAVCSIAFASSTVAKEVFEGLRATATMCLAGFGAWIAYQGLRTWRRQLHGSAQFDASRKMLEATLHWRDTIDGMRSPMSEVVVKHGEDYRVAARRNLRRHFNRVVLRLRKCEVTSIAVEAIEGDHVRDAVQGLRRVVGKLRLAVESQFIEDPKDAILDHREVMAILYKSTIRGSEAFSAEVTEAIEGVKRITVPAIRGDGTRPA